MQDNEFVTVGLYQKDLRKPLSKIDTKMFFEKPLDFLVFPEYFAIDETVRDYQSALNKTPEALEFAADISSRGEFYLIAGTVLEKKGKRIYNTSYVFYKGKKIAKYRKMNLYGREKEFLTPGNKYIIVEKEGIPETHLKDNKTIKFSVLICADVLNSETFTGIGKMKPHIIFLPTTSPYKEDDNTFSKQERDKILYLENARKTGAALVKCCGVGEVFGKRMQGRSLVAIPKKIIYRVEEREEHKELWRIIQVPIEL